MQKVITKAAGDLSVKGLATRVLSAIGGVHQHGAELVRVPLDAVVLSEWNPRFGNDGGDRYDELLSVTRSAGVNPVPIRVAKRADGKYEMLAGGGLRLNAAREAGLSEVEVMCVSANGGGEPLNPLGVSLSHLAENYARSGLTDGDFLWAVCRIRELLENEAGCVISNNALAKAFRAAGCGKDLTGLQDFLSFGSRVGVPGANFGRADYPCFRFARFFRRSDITGFNLQWNKCFRFLGKFADGEAVWCASFEKALANTVDSQKLVESLSAKELEAGVHVQWGVDTLQAALPLCVDGIVAGEFGDACRAAAEKAGRKITDKSIGEVVSDYIRLSVKTVQAHLPTAAEVVEDFGESSHPPTHSGSPMSSIGGCGVSNDIADKESGSFSSGSGVGGGESERPLKDSDLPNSEAGSFIPAAPAFNGIDAAQLFAECWVELVEEGDSKEVIGKRKAVSLPVSTVRTLMFLAADRVQSFEFHEVLLGECGREGANRFSEVVMAKETPDAIDMPALLLRSCAAENDDFPYTESQMRDSAHLGLLSVLQAAEVLGFKDLRPEMLSRFESLWKSAKKSHKAEMTAYREKYAAPDSVKSKAKAKAKSSSGGGKSKGGKKESAA